MANLENSHPDMFNHMVNKVLLFPCLGNRLLEYRVIKLLIWLLILRQKILEDCQEKQKMLVQVSVECELTI